MTINITEFASAIEIGEKLFNARQLKHLSRTQVGSKIGLHPSTVKKYEDGKIKYMSNDIIFKFAEALNLNFFELISKNIVIDPTCTDITKDLERLIFNLTSDTTIIIKSDKLCEETKYIFKKELESEINKILELNHIIKELK